MKARKPAFLSQIHRFVSFQGRLSDGVSLCKDAWRQAKKSADLEDVVREASDCIKEGNDAKKKND
jgi:hypothetical protein